MSTIIQQTYKGGSNKNKTLGCCLERG